MGRDVHLTILGGGIAGLAVGYYARKEGLSFTIYEASEQVGGNCVTLRDGEFLFDSGAHRSHDKDSEVMQEIKGLLGKDLKRIDAPSRIYHKGKWIEFPLSPFNLYKNLGPVTFVKVGLEVACSRLVRSKSDGSFESFAVNKYGRTLAERFLLNYSEKLWGAPCGSLSPAIAGTRMKGLGLRTFLVEAFFGPKAKTEHMEGAFYYPKMGIGMITEKLAEKCGEQRIRTKMNLTSVFHRDGVIQSVEFNGQKRMEVDELVSTVPLDYFVESLRPAAPRDVLALSGHLRYRNMVLVTICLLKESVTGAATIYFPQRRFPFTRVYEPNNRSSEMSPHGRTSLVAEIPCQEADAVWNMSEGKLTELVVSKLREIGLVSKEEVIGGCVNRLYHAYPVLERGFEQKVGRIKEYLAGFRNLRLSGRNGLFTYAWIHNMMRFGKDIVERYDMRSKARERRKIETTGGEVGRRARGKTEEQLPA